MSGGRAAPVDAHHERWVIGVLAAHAAVLLLLGPGLLRSHGKAAAGWFAAATAAMAAAQAVAVATLAGRFGGGSPTHADALTIVRAASGTTLGALASAARQPSPPRLAAVSALALGLVTDWLDGPIARRVGPTRFGAVLDIEADSLLTLGAAAVGVAWGDLPPASLAAPLLRYRDPLLALRRGEDPNGGGPWWCRAAGAAQMVLFAAAVGRRGGGRRPLRAAAHAVSLALVASHLMDGRRRNPRPVPARFWARDEPDRGNVPGPFAFVEEE